MFLGLFFLFKKINDKELGNNKINSNSFVQGFVIAIINPKILVWFVAIYSQFINLNANLSDKIILVLTPSLVDAIWYSVVAILVTGYGLKDFLNKNKLIIQRTIGIFLIIIALSVIYSLVNF